MDLLRSESGSSKPGKHASRRLCALDPRAEQEVAAYPTWQPQAGAESFDPQSAAWAEPHGPISGWTPVGVDECGEASLPMGGLGGMAGPRQAGCGVYAALCGEGPAESRLVPLFRLR